jgi:hypothetical protein
MAPKQRQKIEIEKTHRDPLLSFNQAVTVDCSDFLGTALIPTQCNNVTFSAPAWRGLRFIFLNVADFKGIGAG